MRTLGSFLVFLCLFLLAPLAQAQECVAGTCVPKQDMDVFVRLLRDQKCRADTQPKITLDPITIVEDKDGRVYGTGAEPRPYTVKVSWCNYDITGTGNVNVIVARREPSTWGFRFRLKAQSGFLFTEALKEKSVVSGIDAGVLAEGFYYKNLNLNLMAGFRSAGVALGLDLTRNFGVHAGYALSYDGFRSNPVLGLSFALW